MPVKYMLMGGFLGNNPPEEDSGDHLEILPGGEDVVGENDVLIAHDKLLPAP